MVSPAATEALAQVIATGRSDLDLRPYRAARFQEGALVPEPLVIG